MSQTIVLNWDAATVQVQVPATLTAQTQVLEMHLPIAEFARLLLTQVPAEWFAQVPICELPLTLEVPDPPTEGCSGDCSNCPNQEDGGCGR